MKLNYRLKTQEERNECVEQILAESDTVTSRYLNYMTDYLLYIADKDQTKKEKLEEYPVLTKNREATINKRQISLEEVVSSLENGEDGLYALIKEDKRQIMDPKDPINEKDVEEIPGLKENFETIELLKRQLEKATGRGKFLLKQQIIAKYQEQYLLKASFRGIPEKRAANHLKVLAHLPLDEDITIGQDGVPHSNGLISLFNPTHVSFLLSYYGQLKEESFEDLQSDMHFLLLDLEELAERTLRDQPFLFDVLCWKVDGMSNQEIKDELNSRYGIKHSEQYISTIWKKKIPKMIADQAQKDWIIWHYTNEEYGKWKTCSKCGETKLAHPFFFSKNTSKDGFYSICKECRTKKGKK